MKRILSLILALLSVVLLLSGCESTVLDREPKNKYKIEGNEVILSEVPTESTVVDIVVPDEFEGKKVTKIADFAACNLEAARTVKIGKNVKEIGPWAFENNQKLEKFIVDKDNPYFCDKDGVLFTKDMKTLLFYPNAKDVKKGIPEGEKSDIEYSEYVIPSTVETVRTKAFYKCPLLRSVTIPDSVKVLEEKAFFRCSALQNVTLPKNLEYIGKDAFSYCSSFTEITIPASIKTIETYAFYNCTNLKTVNVLKKEKEIKLGKKWQPTDNGKKMDVKITFTK